DAIGAELLDQSLRDPEGPAERSDVLSEEKHAWVVAHRVGKRRTDRLEIGGHAAIIVGRRLRFYCQKPSWTARARSSTTGPRTSVARPPLANTSRQGISSVQAPLGSGTMVEK